MEGKTFISYDFIIFTLIFNLFHVFTFLNRSLPGTVTAPCLAPTGVSWADKVKAHHTGSATSDVTPAQPCAPTTVQKNSRKNGK